MKDDTENPRSPPPNLSSLFFRRVWRFDLSRFDSYRFCSPILTSIYFIYSVRLFEFPRHADYSSIYLYVSFLSSGLPLSDYLFCIADGKCGQTTFVSWNTGR
jgi:hypothetical protein